MARYAEEFLGFRATIRNQLDQPEIEQTCQESLLGRSGWWGRRGCRRSAPALPARELVLGQRVEEAFGHVQPALEGAGTAPGRGGRSTGTRRTTGVSPQAITTSLPRSAWSISLERLVFAAWMVTVGTDNAPLVGNLG